MPRRKQVEIVHPSAGVVKVRESCAVASKRRKTSTSGRPLSAWNIAVKDGCCVIKKYAPGIGKGLMGKAIMYAKLKQAKGGNPTVAEIEDIIRS